MSELYINHKITDLVLMDCMSVRTHGPMGLSDETLETPGKRSLWFSVINQNWSPFFLFDEGFLVVSSWLTESEPAEGQGNKSLIRFK